LLFQKVAGFTTDSPHQSPLPRPAHSTGSGYTAAATPATPQPAPAGIFAPRATPQGGRRLFGRTPRSLAGWGRSARCTARRACSATWCRPTRWAWLGWPA